MDLDEPYAPNIGWPGDTEVNFAFYAPTLPFDQSTGTPRYLWRSGTIRLALSGGTWRSGMTAAELWTGAALYIDLRDELTDQQ